ncbi:DNA polymerase III subunit alpha [Listeria aquatica FSL S10-1188]|uniref:DNA polymerase III subunit alpha n=1 Tax=Listeria aquatica FSL S10-1188 TaxID=1265818 RepID=W7AVP3_9LIST|nr:PHP domain-containing protein [Listeria aquatica]EUJ17737.1 DNA polymerase III subunit alpha [Listeria aquatica FSL S10-1188]
MGFIHLQVASAFDLLSSTARIKELVKRADEYHYSALSMTNKTRFMAWLNFIKSAKMLA